MKKIYVPLLLLLFLVAAPGADPIDNIAALIGQGNANELSKYFSQSIEITVSGTENVYTKTQAGIILDKFFTDNKPLGVKLLHKVNSNANYQFAVLILTTNNGIFRVSYTMKAVSGSLMLIELRFEPEKAK